MSKEREELSSLLERERKRKEGRERKKYEKGEAGKERNVSSGHLFEGRK